MSDPNPIEGTRRYVDELLGSGMGSRHVRFLERIENPGLREHVHRFHAVEADTRLLSVEENYLIGVCVLCSRGQLATAAMFAKLLRRLGTPPERILEAVARLAIWSGGLSAVDASFAIQKALREYDKDPEAALLPWFPEDPAP